MLLEHAATRREGVAGAGPADPGRGGPRDRRGPRSPRPGGRGAGRPGGGVVHDGRGRPRPLPRPLHDPGPARADAPQAPPRPRPHHRPGGAAKHRLGQAFCEYVETRPASSVGKAGGVCATVVVTMTLDTLVGLKAASLTPAATSHPAGPAGSRRAGIIPAVLGGDSQVLDLGRKRRFHTEPQRIALAQRNGGCTADGCDAPPGMCHAHHDHPGPAADPPTSRPDDCLCPRHHTLAHDPRYQTNPPPTASSSSSDGRRRTAQRRPSRRCTSAPGMCMNTGKNARPARTWSGAVKSSSLRRHPRPSESSPWHDGHVRPRPLDRLLLRSAGRRATDRPPRGGGLRAHDRPDRGVARLPRPDRDSPADTKAPTA